MGPGNRFEIYKTHEGSCGLGIWFDRYPYDYTINITLIKWVVRIGFGEPYTEMDCDESN